MFSTLRPLKDLNARSIRSPSCPVYAIKLCFAPLSLHSFPTRRSSDLDVDHRDKPGGDEWKVPCLTASSLSLDALRAFPRPLSPSRPGEARKLCFAPISRPSTSYFYRVKNVDHRDKPGDDDFSGSVLSLKCGRHVLSGRRIAS